MMKYNGMLVTLGLLLALFLAACDDGSRDATPVPPTSRATDAPAEAATESADTAEEPSEDSPSAASDLVPSLSTDGIEAGSYKFEVTDFNGVVTVAENSSPRAVLKKGELELTLRDNRTEIGVILYLPPNAEPGEYPIIPYVSSEGLGRYTGILSTVLGRFNLMAGTLIIDSNEDGLMSGRIAFLAQPNTRVERQFTVQGAFVGVPGTAE